MTKSPRENGYYENEQPTCLPHPVIIILTAICQTCALQFITTLFPLCTCVHEPYVQRQEPPASIKMDFITYYNILCGHSPIGNKTPKYQE